MGLEMFYADIPSDLADADALLTRYGQWAAARSRTRRCGSAEGNYRPPASRDDDERRIPKSEGLTILDALVAQRALARVADLERVVLAVLYVPNRLPAAVQFRLLRVTPTMAQQRHRVGLRMFDNLHQLAVHSAHLTRGQ